MAITRPTVLRALFSVCKDSSYFKGFLEALGAWDETWTAPGDVIQDKERCLQLSEVFGQFSSVLFKMTAGESGKPVVKTGKADEALERMAELEHDQWVFWSKSLVKNEKIPEDLAKKWAKKWIPYSELSDSDKDLDRKWARKALDAARGQP